MSRERGSKGPASLLGMDHRILARSVSPFQSPCGSVSPTVTHDSPGEAFVTCKFPIRATFSGSLMPSHEDVCGILGPDGGGPYHETAPASGQRQGTQNGVTHLLGKVEGCCRLGRAGFRQIARIAHLDAIRIERRGIAHTLCE